MNIYCLIIIVNYILYIFNIINLYLLIDNYNRLLIYFSKYIVEIYNRTYKV